MRGLNRVIFVSRALRGSSTAVGSFHRVAPYGTSNLYNLVDHSTPSVAARSVTVTGFRYFSSAAATSLAQDLQAKGFNPKEVVLFQYEACPFCNKVKAFMDYYDIPYKVVEVNPINKKEIKWSDYRKVPIVTVDGEQMVDSSDIIDKLVKRIHPDYDLNADEEKKWREYVGYYPLLFISSSLFGLLRLLTASSLIWWVDNHLVHVLSPNIYRTVSEALESFEYITTQGNFSLSERLVAKYGGAAAMYFVSKKLKEKHKITDERVALYGAAEQWIDALKGRKFLGGLDPNLADLAVFGVLRPIRHLKSGRDMVEHTRIGKWFSEMEQAVGQSSMVSEHV
ncbi:Thioredoxin-like superfamily [Sesbania bispinosa]|nr:Thioredoxin-like superfamily [Sesbania bispinosa]